MKNMSWRLVVISKLDATSITVNHLRLTSAIQSMSGREVICNLSVSVALYPCQKIYIEIKSNVDRFQLLQARSAMKFISLLVIHTDLFK